MSYPPGRYLVASESCRLGAKKGRRAKQDKAFERIKVVCYSQRGGVRIGSSAVSRCKRRVSEPEGWGGNSDETVRERDAKGWVKGVRMGKEGRVGRVWPGLYGLKG
jgi:hypothetical protein